MEKQEQPGASQHPEEYPEEQSEKQSEKQSNVPNIDCVKRKTLIFQSILTRLADSGPVYSNEIADLLQVSNLEVMICALEINAVNPHFLELSTTQSTGKILPSKVGRSLFTTDFLDYVEATSGGILLETFMNIFSKQFLDVALEEKWISLEQVGEKAHVVPGKNRDMFFEAASQLVSLVLDEDLTNDLKHRLIILDLAECVELVPVYHIDKGLLFPPNRNDVSRAWLYMMYRERNRCKICSRAPSSPIEDDAKTVVALNCDGNYVWVTIEGEKAPFLVNIDSVRSRSSSSPAELPAETDESEQETDESEQETDESEQETDESEQETDESEQEIDESEQETDESEQNTDELEQGGDESKQETDESEQESAKSKDASVRSKYNSEKDLLDQKKLQKFLKYYSNV